MPYVNIRVAGKISKEEKKKLIEGTAELLKQVLDKPYDSTYTTIEEVDPDNWGKGKESISEIRARS
jgi:4-oxalocrotonate tautomerase